MEMKMWAAFLISQLDDLALDLTPEVSSPAPRPLALRTAAGLHCWRLRMYFLGRQLSLVKLSPGPSLRLSIKGNPFSHGEGVWFYFRHIFWCHPHKHCEIRFYPHSTTDRKVRLRQAGTVVQGHLGKNRRGISTTPARHPSLYCLHCPRSKTEAAAIEWFGQTLLHAGRRRKRLHVAFSDWSHRSFL